MKTRILWNDLKGNPLLAVTTWLFMAVSALMFALTCFLSIGLLGSVDTLMEAAGTPDFLQMHAGEIDETALVRFAAEQEQVPCDTAPHGYPTGSLLPFSPKTV